MADPAHTYSELHDAASRLFTLGLRPEILREAAAVGLAGRKSATAFHPPTYGGYVQWAETHRSLRELLVPLRWTASDVGGFSTVVNSDSTVAITVATGTDRTGRPGYPEPSTKYPRGPLTHAAVEANQLVIPNFPGIETGSTTVPSRCVTWVLLTHTRYDEVRIELSCPAHIGDDGRVDSWSERILIDPIDSLPSLPLFDDGKPAPEGGIDIPVALR